MCFLYSFANHLLFTQFIQHLFQSDHFLLRAGLNLKHGLLHLKAVFTIIYTHIGL